MNYKFHSPYGVDVLNGNQLALLCRLQDQLIIFMALAKGTSRMVCGPPELHTRTAAVIAAQLTKATFEVKQQEKGAGTHTVTCHGAGLIA